MRSSAPREKVLMDAIGQLPLATLIAYGVAAVMTLIAGVTDVRSQRIPNWLTFPALILAPVIYVVAFRLDGLATSLLGILGCGIIPYVIFQNRGMAGGDVKLFAAIGAVAGFGLGIEAEFYAVVFAGVFAMLKLARQRKVLRTFGSTFYLALNPVLPRAWRRRVARETMTRARLGAPIFVGTLFAIVLRVWPAVAGMSATSGGAS